MRRIAFLVLVLPLLLGVRAEAQPEVSVRGNVGATFFQAPEGLGSVLNSGIDVGLGTSVQLFGGLELVLEGGYDRFTLNEDHLAVYAPDLEVGSSSNVEGGDFNLLNATMGLRYVFQSRGDAQPYVLGGAGIYRASISKMKIFQGGQLVQQFPRRTTTSPGVHVAVGSDFRINDTYEVFFEPRYVIVYAGSRGLQIQGSTRYISLRLGMDVTL